MPDEKSQNGMLAFIVFAGLFLITMYLRYGGIELSSEIKNIVTIALIAEPIIFLFAHMAITHEKRK